MTSNDTGKPRFSAQYVDGWIPTGKCKVCEAPYYKPDTWHGMGVRPIYFTCACPTDLSIELGPEEN